MAEAENEQAQEQQQPEPEQPKEYKKLTFQDYFLLACGFALAVLFAIFALKSLDRADAKPSDILENPGSYSILEEGGWLDE